jgi:hypothetical protein
MPKPANLNAPLRNLKNLHLLRNLNRQEPREAKLPENRNLKPFLVPAEIRPAASSPISMSPSLAPWFGGGFFG